MRLQGRPSIWKPERTQRVKPAQLELGGTVTSAVVGRAYAAVERKRRANKSWEDDFEFHIRARRLPKPIRQFRFAESLGRKWQADFAYPKRKLLIEIDGGVWRKGGGAHSHPSNILRDMEKQNDATRLGFYVLRFTSDQVRTGEAIDFLIQVLHGLRSLT
jgi:very-short-patch-repair endonuclease